MYLIVEKYNIVFLLLLEQFVERSVITAAETLYGPALPSDRSIRIPL